MSNFLNMLFSQRTYAFSIKMLTFKVHSKTFFLNFNDFNLFFNKFNYFLPHGQLYILLVAPLSYIWLVQRCYRYYQKVVNLV